MNPSKPVCDFCSEQPVQWRYPCESFTMDSVVGSHGDWAACMQCHGYINCNDYHGLATRVIECLMAKGEIAVEHAQTFYEYLRKLHGMFRECRKGPPVRESYGQEKYN